MLSVFAICVLALAGPDPQVSPSPTPGAAVGNSLDNASDFEAPIVPQRSFSLEDVFTPSYDETTGSSNTINTLGQVPLARRRQLIKIKVPFVTSAPAAAVRGNGDTTLTVLQYLGVPDRRWVFGPTFKIPTASTSDLGTGRWSGGPAAAYIYAHGSTLEALYAETFVSFAGPKSRGAVSITKIQPEVFFSFARGWGVGTSEMEFTYNWQNETWQNVPFGLRVEKSWQNSEDKLAIGFEFEKNLARVQTTNQWTFRLNAKYR